MRVRKFSVKYTSTNTMSGRFYQIPTGLNNDLGPMYNPVQTLQNACDDEYVRAFEGRVAPLQRTLADLDRQIAALQQDLSRQRQQCYSSLPFRRDRRGRESGQQRVGGEQCDAAYERERAARIRPLEEQRAALQREIDEVVADLDANLNDCRRAQIPITPLQGSTGPAPSQNMGVGGRLFVKADVLDGGERTLVQRIYDERASWAAMRGQYTCL